MAQRYIDNITIMADVGEVVELPTTVVVLEDSFTYSTATVAKWVDGDGAIITTPDTSVEGDFIYEGTVVGYAHKIYCSVVVGDLDDNPQSVFPEEIDQFGLPKKSVNTADVPDVDDYQYFKAKMNRTQVEQYQLKQLTEALASKIIMARDINHTRNAVIEIEKYCKDLNDRLGQLEGRVDDLETRVDDLEDAVVVDAENLGTGAEVYSRMKSARPYGNTLQFKTLVAGEGIAIDEDREEITITADIEVPDGGINMDNCGSGETFRADNYEVCSDHIKFGDYMGLKWCDTSDSKSILFVLGVGENDRNFINAGRIFKGTRNLVIEMKTKQGFSGIDINSETGKVDIYENDGTTHLEGVLMNLDAYSTEVAMGI